MRQRKHIVIVGAGFGGLAAAKGLVGAGADVTLIDRSNHHLFQPLLYQVATAALTPSDIASATRTMFKSQDNVRVLMDEVLGIDHAKREIQTIDSGAIPFDYLVLATGSEYGTFPDASWVDHVKVLKTMEDALSIRERLLSAFEQAEREQDEVERARLLTFVVVGGGPTGVEMAGAIAELGRTSLARDYRRVQLEEIHIILLDSGQRVLSAFTPKQSQQALAALQDLGVQVRFGTSLETIDAYGVIANGERIASANVIWSAGTKARGCGTWTTSPLLARNGAVVVRNNCELPDHEGIFAIRDGASFTEASGRPLPGLAPVAKQQGRYVANVLRARLNGTPAPSPFRYRNWGMMAVIGRSKAVADFGWFRLSGFGAWLTWSMVHIFLLVDFRSRGSVYLSWAWAWFTRDRIARLLTRNTQPMLRSSSKCEAQQLTLSEAHSD